MTIRRKLGLGFAVLLLIFLASGVIVDRIVRSVDDRLGHLRDIHEPASEASYEMEINAIGTGLGVVKYLETGDPEDQQRVLDDQGDFERAVADYKRLVQYDAQRREAGDEIESLYKEYRDLGDDLMEERDRQERLLKQITVNFDSMDEISDDRIQTMIDQGAPDGPEKVALSSEAETETVEVGTWFGTYLRNPSPESRKRMADNADDFREEIKSLRNLELTQDEEYWLGRLEERFEENLRTIEEALSSEDALQDGARRFTDLRNRIDNVLDEQMQPLVQRELESVEEAAIDTVGDVRSALVVLLLLGLVMGSGAAAAISRNILVSVKKLLEGAQRIGTGTLDHRIEVGNRDEIGDLALAFNEMADKRQRVEEEVRRLNAELEARVEERTNELTKAISTLEKSEERYRAVVEQTAECLFMFDAETKRILETNDAFRKLFGYTVEDLKEMRIYEIVEDDPSSIDAHVRRNREQGNHNVGERRYRHKDGSLVDVEVSGSVISYEGHDSVVLGIARDVTQRRQAEEELRAAEARYRTLVEQVPAALYTADFGDPPALAYVSPRYEELSGYGLQDHLADPELWSKTIHPEDREWVLAENRQVNLSGDPFEVEYRMVHREGHVVWVQDASYVLKDARGLPLCRQGFMLDVTERKKLAEELAHKVLHDELTGLPNRALFMDRLAHALTGTERGEESLAVLYLDLDNFKVVNDSLGRGQGDVLLVEVARKLKSTLRPGDTAARLGGDEFCILLEDVVDEGEALLVVERLRRSFSAPIHVDGQEVHVSTSVGIALGSGAAYRQGKGAEALLRDADLAMYEAKSRGKNKHVVYDSSMNDRARARLRKENDLRHAIERDELVVYYQPKVDLRSGNILGFEALVRWESPKRGLVPPNEFITLAEETGLIFPVCRWVLEEACRQAKEWGEEYGAGGESLSVAVNVSARQLQPEHGGIVEEVERVLALTGLDPGCLHLEITESVLMEDVPQNISTLAELKALGVHIEIDDFGTGYSSLSYLKKFPVDSLKMDKSFVDKLDSDEESAAIVEAMISLARALNLEVIAEGIETPAQLARLRYLGCDVGQGYHFGRPVGALAAAEILETVLTRR